MTYQEKLEKMLREKLWETDDWGTPGPDDVAEYLSPIIEDLVEAAKLLLDGQFRGVTGRQTGPLRAAIAKAQG